MSLPEWPASLPQDFRRSGYNEQPGDGVLRTSVDAGPEMTRRRTTAEPDEVQGQMRMSGAQRDTFLGFFRTDIKHGATRFIFAGDADHEYKLVPPYYRINPTGGDGWMVQLVMERHHA